jgi:hypothetical protein
MFWRQIIYFLATLSVSSLYSVEMTMDHLVEWELAEESEILWENLTDCYFVRHKSHITRPEIKSGSR